MIHNHLLSSAKQSPSDNHNERGVGISMVVIHSISLPPGEFDNNYIEQFFTNQLDFFAHPYFKITL